MKEEKLQFDQYSNENHSYDNNGDYETFLEMTAPLIGHIVHDFNRLDESLNNVGNVFPIGVMKLAL